MPGGKSAEARTGELLELIERGADLAFVDARGAVLAAREDRVAGRAERRGGHRSGRAPDVEHQLSILRVPEARGELARGCDPAPVAAPAHAVHREELADQAVEELPAARAPDEPRVVVADGRELEPVRGVRERGDGRAVAGQLVEEFPGR